MTKNVAGAFSSASKSRMRSVPPGVGPSSNVSAMRGGPSFVPREITLPQSHPDGKGVPHSPWCVGELVIERGGEPVFICSKPVRVGFARRFESINYRRIVQYIRVDWNVSHAPVFAFHRRPSARVANDDAIAVEIHR